MRRGGAWRMWAGPGACRRSLAPVGRARGGKVGPACLPLTSGRGVPGLGQGTARGNCSGDCLQDTLVPSCDVTYWSLWSPPISDIPAGHVRNPLSLHTTCPPRPAPLPGAPSEPLASTQYNNLSPAGDLAGYLPGPAAGKVPAWHPLYPQACWPLLTARPPSACSVAHIWDPADGGAGTPRLPL